MRNIEPLKNILNGMIDKAFYTDGSISFCRLNAYNKLQTPWGELIPAYDRSDTRAKFRPSICFFESGKIKSVYLQEQSTLTTPVGKVDAELITFYENGNIHRVFPLYGQISGYWTEAEEYALAANRAIQVGEIKIQGKVSCYCFYPTGAIKSLTFWEKEKFPVMTPQGEIKGRIGLSFYESGKLKSFEPQIPSVINTSIGEIMAYNNEPVGVHGDANSVVFSEAGEVVKVKTIQSMIQVTEDATKEKITINAQLERDFIDPDQWKRHGLEISFEEDVIRIDDGIGHKQQFNKATHECIAILRALPVEANWCNTCGQCNKCHGCG